MVLCCFSRFPAVWAVPGRQTRAGGGEEGSPQIPSIPADLGQHQIPKKPSQKIREWCQSRCFPSIQSCQLLSSFSDVFRLCLRTIIEGTRRWGQEFLIPTGSFCPKTPLFTPNGLKSLVFFPLNPVFPSFPPSAGSQLVLVPSLRDVSHDFVYPQPPFPFPDLPKEDRAVLTPEFHFSPQK